ncbi:type IVB secretion system protein IcmX [Legionella lytica]|uniref:Type IVB secretion system protein IcmX n=1 Tax=Legionella lytica TaxID=96232 RepID=A0ABY4YCH8_9GAMM|nr:type IVB secretion system protein IcmX [Legionella lytica]USQ15098.1 type IVB secretion system protein IcmX [Legionella lytica]
MKRLSKFAVINLFCWTTLPAVADDISQYSTQQTAANTQNLVQYLVNLGGYLGYNITQSPTKNNSTVSQTLLNATATQVVQTYMFNTFLGALPVNAFNTALAQIVPGEVSGASSINAWANNTFNAQNFSNPASQQQGKVSVVNNIDQQTFQPDPVNQGLLNILGTPDNSYCMNYDGTEWVGCSSNANGNLVPGSVVSANIIGELPSTYQYFTFQYNQQFLSQLNSNNLTAPLLYSTQSTSNNTGSSNSILGIPNSGSNSQNQGLSAQNQAQQAANFIRYVSGSVTPLQLPNLKSYDTLYSTATSGSSTQQPTLQQIQAQSTLNNYFTSLRTYAAQYSVGLSNLYFIMSKRLPQNQSTTGQAPASQALSEFKMATWRLFNADMSQNNQWINQINSASPATVEKEIATLLAEISYQMYLDRQIQERILLTNSIMLLQNTRSTQPSGNFTSGSATNSQ